MPETTDPWGGKGPDRGLLSLQEEVQIVQAVYEEQLTQDRRRRDEHKKGMFDGIDEETKYSMSKIMYMSSEKTRYEILSIEKAMEKYRQLRLEVEDESQKRSISAALAAGDVMLKKMHERLKEEERVQSGMAERMERRRKQLSAVGGVIGIPGLEKIGAAAGPAEALGGAAGAAGALSGALLGVALPASLLAAVSEGLKMQDQFLKELNQSMQVLSTSFATVGMEGGEVIEFSKEFKNTLQALEIDMTGLKEGAESAAKVLTEAYTADQLKLVFSKFGMGILDADKVLATLSASFAQVAVRTGQSSADLATAFVSLTRKYREEPDEALNHIMRLGVASRDLGVGMKTFYGWVTSASDSLRSYGFSVKDVEGLVADFGVELREGRLSVQELVQATKGPGEAQAGRLAWMVGQITTGKISAPAEIQGLLKGRSLPEQVEVIRSALQGEVSRGNRWVQDPTLAQAMKQTFTDSMMGLFGRSVGGREGGGDLYTRRAIYEFAGMEGIDKVAPGSRQELEMRARLAAPAPTGLMRTPEQAAAAEEARTAAMKDVIFQTESFAVATMHGRREMEDLTGWTKQLGALFKAAWQDMTPKHAWDLLSRKDPWKADILREMGERRGMVDLAQSWMSQPMTESTGKEVVNLLTNIRDTSAASHDLNKENTMPASPEMLIPQLTGSQ